jgi:hypothetical protein
METSVEVKVFGHLRQVSCTNSLLWKLITHGNGGVVALMKYISHNAHLPLTKSDLISWENTFHNDNGKPRT